jgi:cytidylate kinase
MVEMQREIAKSMSCVLDGRDIGTAVLPNANFKFFITADSKVRATRRFNELAQRGENVNFDTLHAEIIRIASLLLLTFRQVRNALTAERILSA